MSSAGRVARTLRQHAETTSLLGVDFLPLRPGGVARPIATAPTSPTAPTAPTAAVAASAGQAAPSGDKAARLEQLRIRYEADAPHAAFITEFNSIVFGDGSPEAELMFVGEAPGRDEDEQGIPFVGKAGQLLNKMIEAMGLSRERVYIANVLKTRPPNNATPTKDEAAACAPYLFGQISIVRPRVLVTLGLPASRTLLETDEAMGQMRGSWRSFRVPDAASLPAGLIDPEGAGLEIPVMPTYHPAYLLRSYTPENRQKVWSDLQQVMARLSGN